jgi:site-specific DNA recombinase
MRRILYGRVSLEEQAEQFGLASQLRALQDYAKAKGYDGVEEMVDEGYLGSDLDRPALAQIRDLVKAGEVEAVIAHDPDRLSRKLAHFALLQDEFSRAGVRLEFVTTPAADTPESKMFLNMKGIFAEYEREKIRERTLRGRREKAKQGFIVGGRVPFGYRYLGKAERERGRLVVDEEKASVVRQIFQWAADGLSVRGIAARLNEMGIPPSLAQRWGRSSVSRLLGNRTYIGEAHYNRRKRSEPSNPAAGHSARHNKYTILRERPEAEWITVPTPAIIDRALFERVGVTSRRNKEEFSGRPTRRYLLRGLLWCGNCSRRMCGDPNHGTPCYRCLGRDGLRLVTERCRSRANAQRLDAAVWEAVSEPFRDAARLRSIIENSQAAFNRPGNKAKATHLRKQIDRLRGREDRAVKTLLDLTLSDQAEIVRSELRKSSEARRRLEEELAALQPLAGTVALDDVGAICREIVGVIENLTDERRQEFMRRIVEHITVTGKDVAILCALPPITGVAQKCSQREHVMGAGRRHLQRPFGGGLTAHIAKIRGPRLAFLSRYDGPRRRRKILRARQHGDHFGQVTCAQDIHAVHHRGFGDIIERENQIWNAVIPRANRYR